MRAQGGLGTAISTEETLQEAVFALFFIVMTETVALKSAFRIPDRIAYRKGSLVRYRCVYSGYSHFIADLSMCLVVTWLYAQDSEGRPLHILAPETNKILESF